MAIWKLETALDRCNAKQGIGFRMVGVVIDKRTLGTAFFTAMSLIFTAGPIIMSLEEPQPGSAEECSPNEMQIAVVKAIFTLNSTCSYRATIGEILAMP